jgi:hypothetical protein
VSGILLLRTGIPFTVTQTQSVQSTGTTNRPNQICDPTLSNPTIAQWFNTACFAAPADATATYGSTGRNTLRGPGSFNIDLSLIKHTRVSKADTELRLEVFNLLNRPQFAQPSSVFGNAAFGTISAMLANAACALCGTTERQVQLAMKVKF